MVPRWVVPFSARLPHRLLSPTIADETREPGNRVGSGMIGDIEGADVRYARTPDGAYIAYQVLGDGPVDLAWQFDFYGNIDVSRESPFEAAWQVGLASFSRLILHDRRATGLSSRNVAAPNLETRAADLVAVLDEVGAEQPVLVGLHEGGAPAALLAATAPERLRGFVWWDPRARASHATDYPWGWDADKIAADAKTFERWGTLAHGTTWAEQPEYETVDPAKRDREGQYIAKASRQTCTPDVARELARIWFETDIRKVLPAVQAATLLMVRAEEASAVEEARYVASLMPHAKVATVSAVDWPSTAEEIRPYLDEVRRFVGIEPAPIELETVLSTVLFTDIVGSTEREASLGDRGWKELIEHHHAIVRDSLVRWRGVENDTAGDGFYATFDGPARAIRCAHEVVSRVNDLGIEIRAGIHTGECELIDGKVGGIAVTIGARIASLGGPSEVLVSQTVKDLVAGSGLTFEEVGEQELKGLPDRWHLYRVVH